LLEPVRVYRRGKLSTTEGSIMPENELKEVVEIIPNYSNLFTQFSQDFTYQSASLLEMPLDIHYKAHGILAALNVALHSMSTQAETDELRERLSKALEVSTDSLNTKQWETDGEY
jgi:hypothetical protein